MTEEQVNYQDQDDQTHDAATSVRPVSTESVPSPSEEEENQENYD
jgi:hypothetical protein